MAWKKGQSVRLSLHGYGLMYEEDAVIDKITVAGVWIKKPKGANAKGPMKFDSGNEPLGPYSLKNGWHNSPYKSMFKWQRIGYNTLKWRIT